MNNFAFLPWLELSLLGETAELNLDRDSNVSIIKCRQYIEIVTNKLYEFEGIRDSVPSSLSIRIEDLKKRGIIADEVSQFFDSVRVKGNDAVHNLKGSKQDAYITIFSCYHIGVWLYRKYSDGIVNEPIPEFQLDAYLSEKTVDLGASLKDLSQLEHSKTKAFALFKTHNSKEGRSYGFINTHGQTVVEPIFDSVSGADDRFYDSNESELRAVRDKEKDLWGFINKEGKYIIEPQFNYYKDFSEGLAAVRKRRGWGFINTKGEVVQKFLYEDVLPFSSGLAGVKDKNGLWGYINTKFQTIINPTFQTASMFVGEYAIVTERISYGYTRSKIINTMGEVVLDTETEDGWWGEIRECLEGIVVIKNDYYGYQFVDLVSGVGLLEKKFDEVEAFYEGLAAIKIDNKWGFVNTKGEQVIKPRFDFVYSFHKGYAEVFVGEKRGIIDKQGKYVVPPIYDNVNLVSNGMARVALRKSKDRKSRYYRDMLWGYSDLQGNLQIPCQYDLATKFNYGIAVVHEGTTWKIIKKDGTTITNVKDDFTIKEISEFS